LEQYGDHEGVLHVGDHIHATRCGAKILGPCPLPNECRKQGGYDVEHKAHNPNDVDADV
jgi:hypothetical protein